MITVSQLWVYPMKSAKGIMLDTSGFDQAGMQNDRRLLAVDENNGFMTARQTPALLQLSCTPTAQGWRLEHPEAEACEVNGDVTTSIDGMVWKDNFSALDAGDAAADWLSRIFDKTTRLAIWKPNTRIAGKYDLETGFADAAPLLITGETSIQQACDWAAIPGDVRRFRPNIVLDGIDAFAEDDWQRIRIGNVEFEMLDGCTRCVLTTRDPDTGAAHPERQPMRVLSEKHSDDKKQPLLGMNAVMRSDTSSARIAVGDEVVIL